MNSFAVLIIGAFLLYVIYTRYTCKGGGDCEENEPETAPRKPFKQSDYCIAMPQAAGCK